MEDRAKAELEELGEFERFVEVTGRRLLAQAFLLTGNLQEAQDLVQETLLRSWNRWPTISSYESPEGWARRVLHNLAVSRWRRRSHPLPPPEPFAAAGDIAAEHLDLVAALGRLPGTQRQALILREVVGLTTDEIALEMHAPVGSVRTWLHRARTALAADLRRGDPVGRQRLNPEEVTRHG